MKIMLREYSEKGRMKAEAGTVSAEGRKSEVGIEPFFFAGEKRACL